MRLAAMPVPKNRAILEKALPSLAITSILRIERYGGEYQMPR
jgi:hypothetical protein